MLSQKISEKLQRQRYLLSNLYQKLIKSIYVRLTLNIKFNEILSISPGSTLATKFLSHTHTDIQTHRHTDTQPDRQTDIFQKQSNRVQDILKRVNPSKTGNRKFARNQYFLLLTEKKVITLCIVNVDHVCICKNHCFQFRVQIHHKNQMIPANNMEDF